MKKELKTNMVGISIAAIAGVIICFLIMKIEDEKDGEGFEIPIYQNLLNPSDRKK